jgi:cytochrome c556
MRIRQIFASAIASAAIIVAAGCATQSTTPAPAPAPTPPPAARPTPAPTPPAASGAAAVIQQRQAAMRQIGGAARALNGATDAAIIRTNAQTVAQIAQQLPSLFPAGSGPESGTPTRASPAIWTNAAGFAEQTRAFNTAAQAVLNAPTPEAAATAARALGGACGSCHTQFRTAAQ